ncbi:heme oxygenase [Chryseobacterium defluvii]|uniref:Heme oxygenase n=1 Tax=Chryseobacterium defluvii TaxID=160396 RepID=A0A495SPI1_9FLAO|nr:heme oxygenase [Chryseobacterium defluvii]RKT01947.1 hypothetical protein BCF58_1176 [Chryseobacterium defluvii]
MKTIHLFQFKNSITHKIPFFSEESKINTLNDLMGSDLINTEKVTEFIIDIPDDFIFEDTGKDDLLRLCEKAKETIDHYFTTSLNDYDVL